MSDFVLKDFFMLPPAAGKLGGSSSNPDVRNVAVNSRGLMVTWEASHAGRITSNNVLYPPRYMEVSAPTFTLPRPKPIQIHHDDHSDPIGRIYSARFVSYSDVNNKRYKDSIIRDCFNKLYDSVSIDDIFSGLDVLDESGILFDENWKGLGELELRGLITDQSAIEKILDNRYDTVSIQFSPKTVYCRKCKRDWRRDSPCEHRPGEIIDGKKNYIVASPGIYGELSYVNHPADPFAGNKSVQLITMGEGAPITNENLSTSLDKKDKRHVVYEIVDSMIEGGENIVENEKTNSEETVTDNVAPAVDPVPVVADKEPTKVEDAPQTAPVVDVDEALRILIEDEGSFTEELSELINDELEKLIEAPVEDAVLSTEKRKALPASTFCGPNKSFPIPDCPHVVAGRRLIGRYKGTGSKESILACIERKAKSLGCDKSEDSKPEEDSKKTSDCNCLVKGMSDQELLSIHSGAEQEIVKRNLSLPARTCSECEAKDSKIKELESTISHLREEHKIVSADCVASDKALIEATNKLQEAYRSTLILFKELKEKTVSLNEIKESVNNLSLEELELTLTQTDMTNVVDFVRSGLTKETVEPLPAEEIPSSPINITNSVPVITETETPSVNQEELNHAKMVVSLKDSKGIQFATRYLNALKSAKKISSDWTLEKASDLVAKSN